jgi:hypothetical protein
MLRRDPTIGSRSERLGCFSARMQPPTTRGVVVLYSIVPARAGLVVLAMSVTPRPGD